MGFDSGDHHDCVNRKEYASLYHWVEALEKALQHQIAQGHNSLLPCHGSHGSPSDVEDNKAKNSVLGSVPEYSPITVIAYPLTQSAWPWHKMIVDTNHLLTVSMPTELGSLATVFKPGREVLSCQSPDLSKDVNSGVSYSAGQFDKTSTPKSLRLYPALTESLVQDSHQSSTRQLHFDSPWPEPPLLVDGHSPINALGKNNGTEAQIATVPLQQACTDLDPDLSNDLALWAVPSKVPNHNPKADSSLCEYPRPGYSSLEQCVPEYSLSESEEALSSSDTCSSQELVYSFEQC